jgi:hypothetical protein
MHPVLVINPRSDEPFVILAHRLVEDGSATVEDLERELRRTYPRAVVRQRELSGESIVTWYVYREGSWIPSSGP